ncbi:MAG: hypothetical protein MR375_01710 [Veillonellaceae bacterium]|nr:hypothetical protein [Veillonellaceae bacterium]
MADLQYEDGKILLKDGTDISGELSSDNLKSMKASALKRATDMPEQGTVGFFQYVRDAVAKGTKTITDAFKSITGKSNDETTPKTTNNVENKPEAKSMANDKAKNAMSNFGKKETTDISVKDTAKKSTVGEVVKNGAETGATTGAAVLTRLTGSYDPDNPPDKNLYPFAYSQWLGMMKQLKQSQS